MHTDIFIKSFNRPFYLDRCLASVEKFVRGNFKVTLLDDGTPEKYLRNISEKYPWVRIIKSKSYNQKIEAVKKNLETGENINGFEIPTDLWIESAKKATDYFIMTEDDCWFTAEINVDELSEFCKKHKTGLLKLGWLGNSSDDKNLNIREIDKNLISVQPKNLILKGEKFMEAFFLNKYKLFTILYKLGRVDNFTQNKYWALNSILMGFFDKNYWLAIWQNMHGKVDEKRQLINASVYYKNHQNNPNFIARLRNEAMKTTFQSSATGSYHEYDCNFDVNLFNHILNEAWLSGEFDALENYPKDFSITFIEKFIEGKMDVTEYRKWVEKFKNQYKNLGCDVGQ